MLCERCGTESEPDARFCAACGSALDQGERLDSRELLRRASEALSRDRDAKKAEDLYRKIINDYPSSQEAELATACLYNIQQGVGGGTQVLTGKEGRTHAGYVSTYKTGRTIAAVISFIGWLLVCGGIIALLVFFDESRNPASISGMALIPFGISLFASVFGLVFVGFGQYLRATFDTADFNGEMLALMKANKK